MLLGYQFSRNYTNKSVTEVSTNNLLAISWQNAFCQVHQNRRECHNVRPTAYSASHFTLHGLWPQPRSKVNCKGSGKVYLPKKLYRELLQVMPAAKSGLHKHEWKKHGTCYGKDPEHYFEDSISLLNQINSSAVRELFAKNVGKTITKEQLNRAFEKAFGKGTGRKVKMVCNRGLVTELWINLKGKIEAGSDIAGLMKRAPNVKGGCQRGKVDAVGF